MSAEKPLPQKKRASTKDGSSAGHTKGVSETEVASQAVQAVVGIVASAGGLDAFKQFFQAIPADNGLAFVLVPHLDPNHESYMVQLLGKQTRMPVSEAQGGQRLEASHVYVIPPNRYLSLHKGVVELSVPPEQSAGHIAIDPFLRTLAADQQERAVCIVLSGTGSHGSLGLRAIKAEGGMVMVQEPSTAEFDPMPSSAVDTGLADYVLPPDQMPEALLAFVRHFSRASVVQPESSTLENDLSQVLALLRARVKFDFRAYRKGMLLRRIQRRMGLNHLDRLSDYLALLHDRHSELSQLGKDMLISVTGFFRDPEMFHFLETDVLPELIRTHNPDLPLRVWVPGCATGEEAYSIAMLAIEQCKEADKVCPIQVFATDVDEAALEVARHGLYQDGLLTDLPRERRERFFIRTGDDTWQVRKPLREAVLFASQNLLADAPFSKMDIVACRNLLIYLEPEVQQKLLQLFHFALNESGFLILGPSESIGRKTNLYTPVSKKWRIFRRLDIVHPTRAGFPVQPGMRMSNFPRALPLAPIRNKDLSDITRKILLDDYTPAAVVTNRRYEVLHFSGPTHLYLQQPDGPPSRDLLALALAALRPRLRAAVLKAANEETRVDVGAIRARRAGKSVLVGLSVRPLPTMQKIEEPLFLIVFQDEPEVPQADSEGGEWEKNNEQLVRQLESELKTSREDLQSTVEELESSNEELKGSNEEVMSMNEELQSTNEELETSREELQSLNEELTTVNAQLRDKVDELEDANDDMNNLLSSVDNATLFLGLDRTIQRFTPSATRLFNLIATDVGRPIGHITACFDDPELSQDIDRVIQNLVPCEREVSRENEQWFLRRLTPYRTADNRISGVVLTLADITPLKRAELDLNLRTMQLEQRLAEHGAELRRERNFIDAILNTVGALIVVIDTEQRVVRFNAACNSRTGYDFAEFVGTPAWMDRIPPDEREEARRVNERLLSGEDQIQHENHWIYRDGSMHLIAWCNSVLRDEAGQVQYIIATGIDITEQHEAENRARETLEEASRLQRLQTANELATLLAHELNQPLAAIATYAAAGLQIIERAPLEQEKLARTLERISQQSLRAGDAIRHMRAFVGRGRIDPVPLDLNMVLRSTCTLMRSKAHSRGINLVLDLVGTLPPVMGVGVHIEQVLLNLLRNAIDAIRDAGMTHGTITVKARKVDGMAQVTVFDTGHGIDEAMAEKVFEPLASHKEYGLGVGLRISRSLIEAHHGRLWVEPRRPGGIFHFVLPFVP